MAATADPRAKQPPAHHLEPWGRQQQPPRVHRVPAHPAVEESGPSADRDRRRSSSHSHRRSTGEEPCDGGIEDLRAKLMGHLRDRLRVVPHPTAPLPPPPPKAPEPDIILATLPPAQQQQQQEEERDVADKPWKLRERTRRRPAALTSWPAAPSRRRKRAPFSVALAPEEVEDDIYALTGGRPRRRPRKRPRAVQRQLDSLFPGLWLAEITADDYKVPDAED